LYYYFVKRKAKDAQLLSFQFGANVHQPSQAGFFIYHGCRLISTPEKLSLQFEKNYESKGIIGIINTIIHINTIY
jgi:hypothetical protein